MIYGLTHDDSGRPITRLAKAVKIGFGYPRGAAVHVYIDRTGEWVVEVGVGKDAKSHRFSTMPEAQKFYGAARQTAPERKYPAKLPYFTFQRVASNAELFPDWHAIELHGSKPTEVPVVFGEQDPLSQKMEWWSAAELKCGGNGRDAARRCSAAKGPEQQVAAKAAMERGEQWFPIVGGCGHGRCPEATGDKPLCKPHSRLTFLLAKAPSLGTVCTYDSTGYRTAVWLSSPLNQVRQITGDKLAGVAMRLKLQAYKTSFNGKPSVQIGATLYMPEADILELIRRARQQADEFAARQLGAPVRQIAAPEAIEAVAEEEPRLSEADEAQLLTGEFYGDPGDEPIPLDPETWVDDAAAAAPAYDVTPRRKSKNPEAEAREAAVKASWETKGESD